jgi:hypothetical protein
LTPHEHRAQRDMVVRSLLVSPVRTERSEERPRRPAEHAVVFVDVPMHRFVLPVVNERRPL